ncbi:MAG TPA: ABC transporter permease [Candidatus Baltobacteraceae bacterium]|nr:ABC transporter permease [Candidatus Baltobacteraceae bacterium]
MTRYLVRRLWQSVLVLFGISIIIFIILHLTGDPAVLLMPPDATQADIDNFRKLMGFNDPLFIRWPPWEYLNPPWRFLTDTQYGRFFIGVTHGDFGNSFRHQQPAMSLVMERMPATIELTLAAMAIAISIAVPVGILSAVRRNSVLDHAGMVVALLGQSMPVYWLGIMFILLFAVRLDLLPAFGSGSWQHLVLPATTLGAFSMARIARLTRSSMLEVLGQEYVRTARAKGVSEWRLVLRHALKNAAIPVITIIGLDMGTLLGGAVITETIFAWPGVGRLAVQAISYRDYPLVQSAVFLLASIFVLINFLVDILYTCVDPRVAYK